MPRFACAEGDLPLPKPLFMDGAARLLAFYGKDICRTLVLVRKPCVRHCGWSAAGLRAQAEAVELSPDQDEGRQCCYLPG